MAIKIHRTERRSDALSRERIVAAAVAILDVGGESALTFRALAARLATGSGAIYWHVADKDELLGAATDDVIARAMAGVDECVEPRAAIHALALGVFDAIDAHPWVGAQLVREPWLSATLRVFEGIGSRLRAIGVPDPMMFDAWSALVTYVLGAAGQNAANARRFPPGTDRTAHLAATAAHWARLDPRAFPFLRRLASELPEHDDREQFTAGVTFILAGVATRG